MLDSLSVQRLRCFHNTGALPLRRLNILVGANNSGKSTLLSAVELMTMDPDSLSISPLLASFDSSVRQQWSPGEKRPTSFVVEAEYRPHDHQIYGIAHEYARREDDGSGFVRRAHHWVRNPSATSREAELQFTSNAKDGPRDGYKLVVPKGTNKPKQLRWMHAKGIPYDPRFAFEFSVSPKDIGPRFFPRFGKCSVVRPSRLLPRPVYLLDDPTLDEFDREVISALRLMWMDSSGAPKRSLVVNALKSLGLITTMQATTGTLRGGRSRTVEVRVATHKKRAESSLADVGFGVSQVLPLVVADAQLQGGTLIAYQPEVHLHPFAQSRLADFFVDSTKRGNQVFVETHSEHLILRTQYLIAKGILSPDDVSLFFLENRTGASRITRVGLDSKGVPDQPWPSGFLDVGLTLARELSNARLSSK